jgi:hypothetical protein
MFGLLNWRLWVAVAFLCLLPILYMKGRHDGRQLERAATGALVAQANVEARKMEQRRQDRADEAGRLARAREAAIHSDVARARDAVDRLRDTLDAVERASAQSHDAARKSIAALADVFQQCSREYRALAQSADGHASDSLMLQQAWPK